MAIFNHGVTVASVFKLSTLKAPETILCIMRAFAKPIGLPHGLSNVALADRRNNGATAVVEERLLIVIPWVALTGNIVVDSRQHTRAMFVNSRSPAHIPPHTPPPSAPR